MLGTLGKRMAGVPESAAEAVKDEVMVDAPPAAAAGNNVEGVGERASGASTPAPATTPAQTPGAGGGGAKGKKKKGKR